IDDVASINIFNKTLKDISEKILEQFVIQSQKRFLENLSGVVKTPSAATPLSEDAPTQSLP
ncbi:MAG TPA: hypothetical protein VI861_02955, partial [Rickettsiales bacterium]|nr:hypothetical protein [Rickettsiales bacterium]